MRSRAARQFSRQKESRLRAPSALRRLSAFAFACLTSGTLFHASMSSSRVAAASP